MKMKNQTVKLWRSAKEMYDLMVNDGDGKYILESINFDVTGMAVFRYSPALMSIAEGEQVPLSVLSNLERMAGDWKMCDVGNLCDVIPRNEEWAEPKDEKLHELGCLFGKQLFCLGLLHPDEFEWEQVNGGEDLSRYKDTYRKIMKFRWDWNDSDFEESPTVASMARSMWDFTDKQNRHYHHDLKEMDTMTLEDMYREIAKNALNVHKMIEKRAAQILKDMGYEVVFNEQYNGEVTP